MKLLLSTILLLGFGVINAQDWKVYPHHQENTYIYFPSDEGVHLEEPTEWWFLVGHVNGETSGDYYTFMLTYFHHEDLGFDGFRIFNLTNETKDVFYPQSLPVLYNLLAEDSLNIIADPIGGPVETWKNKTDAEGKMIPFQYELSAVHDHESMQLELDTYKKPLIIGDSGHFNQGGFGNYTYYYAQTGIDVSGTIIMDGFTEEVSGMGWIDRQIGTFSAISGEAYEWFSIHLSNGVDLAFWNIFTPDFQVPDTSTYILCSMYINDSTDYYTTDFTLERLKFVYLEDTDTCYAQQWNFRHEDIDLIVTTLSPNREVQLPFKFYEGATNITGTYNGEEVTGVGFAELLHSYEIPELDFINPDTAKTWISHGETIEWEVLNPDDGNPLYYTLSYSTDDGETFELLYDNGTEKKFFWDFSQLDDSTVCVFRLTGSSIDGTLSKTLDSEKVTIINTSSTEENFYDPNRVLVFPNPTNGLLSIKSDQLQSIKLYGLNGQYIKELWRTNEINMSFAEVDISGEKDGLYLIKIQTNKNTVSKKIILNRF